MEWWSDWSGGVVGFVVHVPRVLAEAAPASANFEERAQY